MFKAEHFDAHAWADLFRDAGAKYVIPVAEHHDAFTAQCLNYLKATGKPLCLLLNFAKPRVEAKRYRGPK